MGGKQSAPVQGAKKKGNGHHGHRHGHHHGHRHRPRPGAGTGPGSGDGNSGQPAEKPRDLTGKLGELMDGTRTTLLLSDLDLRDCELDQVCVALRADTTIKELDLANNFLTDAVLETCLLETLLVNTTICSLRIAGNHFSGEGVRALRAFLSCRGALISARKKGTTQVELRALGINATCGVLLREFLTDYQKVTSLNLHENPLRADGVKLLCEGLVRSTSIRSLVLYGSDMGPWGAFHLAKALPLTGITRVNLYKSHLEDNGATIIADSLSMTPNLRSVLLGYNNIHDAGAQSFGKALANNENLRELDLYSNSIGDEGVMALAVGLRSNKGLRFLLLAKNRFGRKAVKELADAAAANYQIQAIDLGLDTKLRESCSADATTLGTHLDENRTSYEGRKRLRKFNRDALRRSNSSSGLHQRSSMFQSQGLSQPDDPGTPGSPTTVGMFEAGMRGSMVLPRRLMNMLQEEALRNGGGPNGHVQGKLVRNGSGDNPAMGLGMGGRSTNSTSIIPRRMLNGRSRAMSERGFDRNRYGLGQNGGSGGVGVGVGVPRQSVGQSSMMRTFSDPAVPTAPAAYEDQDESTTEGSVVGCGGLEVAIGSGSGSDLLGSANASVKEAAVGHGHVGSPLGAGSGLMTPPRAPTAAMSVTSPVRHSGAGYRSRQLGFSPPVRSPGSGSDYSMSKSMPMTVPKGVRVLVGGDTTSDSSTGTTPPIEPGVPVAVAVAVADRKPNLSVHVPE